MATAGQLAVKYGAVQKAAELDWLLGQLPDDLGIIVEIGCYKGGTLWLWTQIAEMTIGIDDGSGLGPNLIQTYGAYIINRDSHSQAAYEWLTTALSGEKIDLLFIDGDHTFNGVTRDFYMYAELARLVAFHDIAHHPDPGMGVEKFWRFLLTQQPDGTEGFKSFVATPGDWGGIGLVDMRKILVP
jgi:hypothetical protein